MCENFSVITKFCGFKNSLVFSIITKKKLKFKSKLKRNILF